MQMDARYQKGGPAKVVLVGAGHRCVLYGSYALQHPDRLCRREVAT
jgi:hypothetical protein